MRWPVLLLIAAAFLVALWVAKVRTFAAGPTHQVSALRAPTEAEPELQRPGPFEAAERERSLDSSAAAGADAPRLSVRVSDREGAPLDSARVTFQSQRQNESKLIGLTDSSGEVKTAQPLDYPAHLVVCHEGYVGAEVLLQEVPTSAVSIALNVSTVIRGRVVARASGIGVDGIKVLAWSQELGLPALDLAERALRGADSRAIIALSGKNGEFELKNVSPSCRYTAVAAGPGIASFEPTSELVPGETAVRIEVGFLYGSRVSLTQADPLKQQILDRLAPPLVNPIQPTIDGASYVYQPSFLSVLAGLTAQVPYGSLTTSTYLFVSEIEAASIGSSVFSVYVPGFEPIITALSFPRVTGLIEEIRLPLIPSGEPMAKCSFKFRLPASLSKSESRMRSGLGQIVVRSAEAPLPGRTPIRASIRVMSFDSDDLAIDLPTGTYDVHYSCTATGTTIPAASDPARIVELGNGGKQIEFALENLGGLEIHIQSDDGNELSGGLSLLMFQGVPSTGEAVLSSRVLLTEAPYVVAPLVPGLYTIVALGHSSLKLGSSQHMMRVEPGRLSVLIMPASAR